jgi:hypothetical protein
MSADTACVCGRTEGSRFYNFVFPCHAKEGVFVRLAPGTGYQPTAVCSNPAPLHRPVAKHWTSSKGTP